MNSKNESSVPATPGARTNVRHPHVTMAALYLGAFTGMLSETALNIALPDLQQMFHVSSGTVQWLIVGYMLVIGLVLPFTSTLLKMVSVRKLVITALSLFLAGSVISACAPGFTVLLAGRMIQGIGTGLILPITFAVVLELFPPHQLGTAMGITALMIMAAPAIGPTLSGIIIHYFSWRGIFFAFAGILTVAIAFAVCFLVNPYKQAHVKIDRISCILSIIGFGGLVTGAGLSSDLGWTSPLVLILLSLGCIALCFYSMRQLRIDNPILNLETLKIKKFTLGTTLVMINFGITLSSMYLLPQFFQTELLIPVQMTGVLMIPGGICNAVVSFFSGKLYDRVGSRIPVRTGFFLSIVGAILLCLAGHNSSPVTIVAAHCILMIGVPLAMSPAQTDGLRALPKQLSADGSTILNTMQQVTGALCTAVTTSLYCSTNTSKIMHGATEIAARTAGFRSGFIFTFILALAGFIVSFAVKNQNVSVSGSFPNE